MIESIFQVLRDYRKLPVFLASAMTFLLLSNGNHFSMVVQSYCHNIECLELVNQLLTFMTFISLVSTICTAIRKNFRDESVSDHVEANNVLVLCAIMKWLVTVVTIAATGMNPISATLSGMDNRFGLGFIMLSGAWCYLYYRYLKYSDV